MYWVLKYNIYPLRTVGDIPNPDWVVNQGKLPKGSIYSNIKHKCNESCKGIENECQRYDIDTRKCL